MDRRSALKTLGALVGVGGAVAFGGQACLGWGRLDADDFSVEGARVSEDGFYYTGFGQRGAKKGNGYFGVNIEGAEDYYEVVLKVNEVDKGQYSLEVEVDALYNQIVTTIGRDGYVRESRRYTNQRLLAPSLKELRGAATEGTVVQEARRLVQQIREYVLSDQARTDYTNLLARLDERELKRSMDRYSSGRTREQSTHQPYHREGLFGLGL